MNVRPVPTTVGALVVVGGAGAVVAARTDTLGSPSDLVWLSGFPVFAIVGAIILEHRPRHPVGRAFVVAGVGPACAALLDTLGIAYGSAGLRTVALMVFGTTWVVATTYTLLFFPDGRLPSRRWRPVAWAVLAICVATCVAVAVRPTAFDDPSGGAPDMQRSPWAIEALGGLPDQIINGCTIASAVITVLAAGSLVLRWRRADGVVREQLSWLALGAMIILVLVAAGALALVAYPSVFDSAPALGAVFETALLVTIPLVTLAAMVHRQLFDVELMLRRSVVYVVLTGVVLATYVATLAVASQLVGGSAGAGAAVVASAVVAVALAPVRDLLDRLVGRLLFGDRRQPQRALASVGAELNGAAGPESVLPAAVASIRDALRLGYVAVRLDGEPTATAESGDVRGELVEVELVALGRTEGLLLVGPRDRGDRLTARDLALVDEMARQVALTARSVRLGRALQASRERIVGAREDERRRLRRDLHDGLGPLLAGLTLQADTLASGLAPESDAGDLAGRITAELRQAVLVVRQVVDGLRPADLDQLGLAEVLSEHARSLSSGDVVVEVRCSEALEVGAATEVAAYRIATEAMTNAVRHARAACCTVTVAPGPEGLVVRVVDDGIGLPAATGSGLGMGSMRERAEEIGGRLVVSSPAGRGTAVVACLPLEVGRSVEAGDSLEVGP